MNRLIEFFVKQKVFSDLITVFTVLVGIACLVMIKREAFPNINFDLITITTVYPGASPEEIEKLITSPLEQELKEVDGVKSSGSVSREGVSMIILQLDPDQTTDTEAKSDVQDVIDRVTDLPKDSEDPIVSVVESSIYPIIQVSLTAKDISELEFRKLSREIERKLEDLSNVAKVTPTGMRELEVKVKANIKKLAQYRLSLEDLVNSLQGQNVSIPAGTFSVNGGEEALVRTIGDYQNLEEIENTIIRANELEQGIKIKDVAKVEFDLEKADQYFRTNGQTAINLTVMRKSRADSIRTVDQVKEKVLLLEKEYSDRINFSLIDDESVWIKMRLSTLSGNLVLGLVLVIIILSLLLPPSVALIVGLGIPVSFLATMIVFYQMDYSLNLLSMLGLIIVVGMLVDDAVVATENSMRLYEEGATAEDAAIKGTQQVVMPILGSVLTTVVAFLPLMFMSGIFGKFVKFIPMGVILALLFSLLEAFFILPNHFARWMPAKGEKKRSLALYEYSITFWNESVLPPYKRAVRYFIEKRYWVMSGVVGLIVMGGLIAGQIGFILFPAKGIEIFFIAVDAPLGTKLETTSEMIREVEKAVLSLPKTEIKDFTSQIGLQQKDPGDPSTKYLSNVSLLVVYLTPEADRKRSADQIIEDIRKRTEGIKDLKIAFEKVQGGPPVGKAISISVRGQEYQEILKLAEEIKADVAKIQGTSDLELNYQLGKREIIVNVDSAAAKAAGLSIQSIGYSIRAAIEGVIATNLKALDETIDIRVMASSENIENKDSIRALLIPNQMGNLIPVNQVTKLKDSQGVSSLIHDDNQRAVTVLGEVDIKKTNANIVVAEIQKKLPEYYKKYPSLNVKFGGENEDTAESMQSLALTFGVALIGIFCILVLTFQNLLQPLLVALTIPIGFVAIQITFFLHGEPNTFMGSLGIIALGGVIVNNAIVLVDFVNALRLQSADLTQTIVDSCALRLRPIFLTTMTTVVGILPTAYGIGGNDEFVKPIALALGWGLFFGSAILVFFFPAMIRILDDIINFFSKKKAH